MADKPIYFVTPALVNRTTGQQQWLKRTTLHYFFCFVFFQSQLLSIPLWSCKNIKSSQRASLKVFNESSVIPQPKGQHESKDSPEASSHQRPHSSRDTLTAVTNTQTGTGDKATQENCSWVSTPVRISQPRTSQDSLLAKIPALMLTTI